MALVLPLALPAASAGDTPAETVDEITVFLAAAQSHTPEDASAALTNLSSADALFDAELAAAAVSPYSGPIAGEWGAAMDGAVLSVESADGSRLAYYRQVMLKLQYALAWAETWHALNASEDAAVASAWFPVVAQKFAWDAAENDAASAIENISARPGEIAARRQVVYDVTVARFAEKVLEEVAEVALNLPSAPAVALEKAGEGLGYFYGLRFALEEEVGPVQASLAEGAVRASVAAAWRADAAAAADAKAALDRALTPFLGTDDLRGELLRLHSLAGLVSEEYGAAVDGGAVVDPVEYNETLAFLGELEDRWEAIAPQARALPGGAEVAAEVDVLLLDLHGDVVAKGDPSEVAAHVQTLQASFSTLRSMAPAPAGA
ncbi:MAG TPA: hypothetical protein VGB42_00820, partial [Candidatus Thermoplasmatota archaeon]